MDRGHGGIGDSVSDLISDLIVGGMPKTWRTSGCYSEDDDGTGDGGGRIKIDYVAAQVVLSSKRTR